ncbi:MAG: RCC1 repeat-containing protein [Myxococcales bacterium]|nr:RCC1 repeat-containing protein [Myxococcales bacterium]
MTTHFVPAVIRFLCGSPALPQGRIPKVRTARHAPAAYHRAAMARALRQGGWSPGYIAARSGGTPGAQGAGMKTPCVVLPLALLLALGCDPPDSDGPVAGESALRASGRRPFTRLTVADWHACAIGADARVRCCGYNRNGQLGDGTTVDRAAPVEVPGISGAVALASGAYHSCALLGDGTVRCWGRNHAGQLGDGTTTDRAAPTAVYGLTGVSMISAGTLHTCALRSDGVVRCWGANAYGELGDGTLTMRTLPVSVGGGIPRVAAIAAGSQSTCALLAIGEARCWGANTFGQLGDGTTSSRSLPVAVSGVTSASAIGAGVFHTCAVLSDGSAHCWGRNAEGQLGNGTTTESHVAVAVSGLSGAVAIAPDGSFTCTLLADGTVRCFGSNARGQLGDGTTTTRKTPVLVPGLTGAEAIAIGGSQSCALLSDGTARCWGHNIYGQLGDGTTVDRYAPVAVSGLTAAIQPQIAAGFHHTCALRPDRTVRCRGWNPYGQLGDGTTTDRRSPTPVSALAGVSSIAVGGYHTCAQLGDGTASCWGYNANGQLGDATYTNRSAPVAVYGLTGVTSLAAGFYHTCALRSDGTVRCWGRNNSGQPGDGTTSNRLSPVSVTGLAGVIALAAGDNHTCALLGDGRARCWGANGSGQVGDNSQINRLAPVVVTTRQPKRWPSRKRTEEGLPRGVLDRLGRGGVGALFLEWGLGRGGRLRGGRLEGHEQVAEEVDHAGRIHLANLGDAREAGGLRCFVRADERVAAGEEARHVDARVEQRRVADPARQPVAAQTALGEQEVGCALLRQLRRRRLAEGVAKNALRRLEGRLRLRLAIALELVARVVVVGEVGAVEGREHGGEGGRLPIGEAEGRHAHRQVWAEWRGLAEEAE